MVIFKSIKFLERTLFFSIKFLLGIFLKERNNHQKKYLLQFFVWEKINLAQKEITIFNFVNIFYSEIFLVLFREIFREIIVTIFLK
jgi:hypothetical protein